LCSSTALAIRTGTLTSPNAMAPDQIDRIFQFLRIYGVLETSDARA
jgi:hypothetical protein